MVTATTIARRADQNHASLFHGVIVTTFFKVTPLRLRSTCDSQRVLIHVFYKTVIKFFSFDLFFLFRSCSLGAGTTWSSFVQLQNILFLQVRLLVVKGPKV